MSQPPQPTNVSSSGMNAPRRLPQPTPSGPHAHHISHASLSHPLGHSSNSPMLRSNHGHNHIHSDLDSASLSSNRFNMDWEAKERELEEAKARATQMEKTMRWWSDCTANWREKWSKVRTERNKAREEAKHLRTKLELAVKDCSSIKREKQMIENDNEFLRNELERLQNDAQTIYASRNTLPEQESAKTERERIGTSEESKPLGEICPLKAISPIKSERSMSPVSALSPRACLSPLNLIQKEINGFTPPDETFGAVPKMRNLSSRIDYDSCDEKPPTLSGEGCSPTRRCSSHQSEHCFIIQETTGASFRNLEEEQNTFIPLATNPLDPGKFLETLEAHDVEYLQQKLTHLKLRLDEATKTIQIEREEKGTLHRAMELLQMELSELRERVGDLKRNKQDAERQLLSAQEQHRQQVISLQQDRRDEASTRETLDRRLADLRSELERLQTENAAEWGRRERVETERQALERENKKLRAAIADLQERLEKRNSSNRGLAGSSVVGGSNSGSLDLDGQQVHAELEERNKELIELKHAHNKLKKALQDKSIELSHGLRRAEHSEAEVRRLRARIDELKREVATAQDELDAATNNVRKLQRTNEELQEQNETLQMQTNHLQNRIRSGSFLSHRESLLQDTLSEDDGNEY